MNTPKLPNLDQQRAQFAWKKVEEHSNNKELFDKYVNQAKGAPALIQANGLLQTLAFYWSKQEWRALANDILEWLKERKLYGNQPEKGDMLYKSVMKNLVNETDLTKFMTAQEETLALLSWIRRFASSFKGE